MARTGGQHLICGVDEAGRGPLAGPVVAAAVILDPARPVEGLADSKRLSSKRRTALALEVRARSYAWGIGLSTVEEIDSLNILQASLLAMRRAVRAIPLIPDEVWVDGNQVSEFGVPAIAFVGGDGLHPPISAASILAKTTRDAIMEKVHCRWPEYGFDRHKGYPTAAHLQALDRYGVLEVHRRSFAPVRRLMAQHRDVLG